MVAKRAFRATQGLDAGGEKVINVATGDKAVLSDGVNVDFFHLYNTIQQYKEDRAYDQYFAAIYNRRVYYAKQDIPAPSGPFNPLIWEPLRVDPSWAYVNSTIAAGRNLESGEYISADNRFNNLIFNMPTTVVDGDTITVKDVGGQSGTNDLLFKNIGATQFEVLGKSMTNFRSTIPFSMLIFIYKKTGNKWVVNIDAQEDQSYFVQPSTHPFQLQSGYKTWRQTSQGRIDLQLPKHANHGDMIYTYDIDGMNAVNHSTLRTHPDSVHSIGQIGVHLIESRTSGNGIFVFDANTNIWQVWDGDQRTRIKVVRTDTDLLSFDHVLVAGDPNLATQSVTLTLPTKVALGDKIVFTLDYMRKGQSCTIKVKDGSVDNITGDKSQFQFQKRSDYPATGDWPKVKLISINADTDYVPYIELTYTGVTDIENAWVIGQVVPKVEKVDPTRRDRLGVAALASQDEVNKNHENNPSDELIVTPKTLANKTATETRRGLARIATTAEVNQVSTATYHNDTIVTPKKLNERTATETRRGLAEIATQAEANGSSDDITIVTPKKLHNRISSESLTGILALTKSGATPGTARNLAGTNVYNFADHQRAVTPKTLDQLRSTETAKGVVYLATEAEVIGGSVDGTNPIVVTPVQLHKKTATESRHGFTETATQAEVNAGTDDFRYITPKKLEARKATESLGGITEVATQAEISTGTDDYRFVSPKKLKTHFDNTNHIAVSSSAGMTQSGTIWGTVDLSIHVPTETQRGTARLATQAEVNTGTANNLIVTPATLHAKKSTQAAEGIIRCATQAETVTGTAVNLAVTPGTFKYVAQTEATWSGNETRRGFVKLATDASTWVGNNTDGSTQALTSYTKDGHAVSPYGLNFALQNYLPKMATAQNALKLGNVVAADWVRRTVAQTITGAMTFSATATMQGVNAQGVSVATLAVRNNTISAIKIGTVGVKETAGIQFIATHNNDETGQNNWNFYAGGGASNTIPSGRIGFTLGATGSGAVGAHIFSMDRAGDVYAQRNITSASGHLYLSNIGATIRIGGTATTNQVVGANATQSIFGNTGKITKVYGTTGDGFVYTPNGTSSEYKVIHTGNYSTHLNGAYVRRDGSTTMTGSQLCSNTTDNTKYLRFKNDNRYITSRGNDLVFGNTDTTNGRIVLDSNQNPAVKIGNYTYEIYHKGNKPTAQDVGAIDVTGSASNNITIRDWIRIGNVKIMANNLTKTVEFIWDES